MQQAGEESAVSARIQKAIEECLEYSSGLGPFLNANGDSNLRNYYKSLHKNGPCPCEVEQVIAPAIKSLYPGLEPISGSIPCRAGTPYHAGIMTEAFSAQSMMLEILAAADLRSDMVLVFLCGAVRLNNQTYPRGVWFGDHRIPLLRNDSEQRLAHACEPMQRKDLDRFVQRARKERFDPGWIAGYIEEALESFPDAPFVDQTAIITSRLFSSAFRALHPAPQIIVLPLETITGGLLLESFDRKDIFYRMLFNRDVRECALRAFDGISDAWTGRLKGTQFFTGADARRDQTALYVEGEEFVGRERPFRLAIDPEAVKEALSERRIAPGVLMSLMLLLSRGMHVSGGYFQCTYLPKMYAAMSKFLKLVGESSSRFSLECSLAPLVSYGFVCLAGENYPAGVDSALAAPEQFLERLTQRASELTVDRAFRLGLAGSYKEIVPKAAQDANLRNLTHAEVFAELGLTPDFPGAPRLK